MGDTLVFYGILDIQYLLILGVDGREYIATCVSHRLVAIGRLG